MEYNVKRLLCILIAGTVVWPSLTTNSVYAASATLSLSPSSSSVSQGSTLTVTVRVNSDEPVNAVQANLSYPANLLDFVSIGSTSAFSIVAQSSGGGGSVQIGRGALPAVSGSQSVATVRFRAKTNTGTAAISFAGGSSVVSANSNNNIMTGSSGGNYSLKAPPVAAPQAPKDTIPPTIKDLKVAETTISTATITWTTSEPATSEVSYGLHKGYGLLKVDATMVTEHKVILDSPLIIPATKFHFMVKSVDPAGNAVSSDDTIFTTAGATLNITVLNQSKEPVSGAKVTLAGEAATTDKKGKAQLKDLPTGKIYGVVEYKGAKTVVSADIDPIDQTTGAQTVTFNIKTSDFPLVVIIPIVLILLAALLWLSYKRKWYKPLLKRFIPPKAQSTITTDVPATAPEPPTIRPTETGNTTKKLP